MGRIKIPPGKQFTKRSRELLQEKTERMLHRMIKQLDPQLPKWEKKTYHEDVIVDPVAGTAYGWRFEVHNLPKSTLTRVNGDTTWSEPGPYRVCFLLVQEYRESKPCIFLQWRSHLGDSFPSEMDAHRVGWAFDFDPLRAIEFYRREKRIGQEGVHAHRYQPPPAEPQPLRPKFRRLDLAK
jgi:hypothetical protein